MKEIGAEVRAYLAETDHRNADLEETEVERKGRRATPVTSRWGHARSIDL